MSYRKGTHTLTYWRTQEKEPPQGAGFLGTAILMVLANVDFLRFKFDVMKNARVISQSKEVIDVRAVQ